MFLTSLFPSIRLVCSMFHQKAELIIQLYESYMGSSFKIIFINQDSEILVEFNAII
jgi:hypothetical protein